VSSKMVPNVPKGVHEEKDNVPTENVTEKGTILEVDVIFKQKH
jgi:hypothetical protein